MTLPKRMMAVDTTPTITKAMNPSYIHFSGVGFFQLMITQRR